MVTKPVIEVVNPFVKVMQSKVPEYKGICSLLSIKRPYSSKYSKDIFPRFIRYYINSKCLKISMKEYENLIKNKYMSETRSKKCDHSIKILLDSTHLTFPAIMIALGYISKLKKNTITTSLLHHQNNSEVKILTLSLMASMKAHYDNVYSNKSWSTVSGISLRELNILESNFLRDINFDLYIDEKIFFNYMDKVEDSLNEYYEAIAESINKDKITSEVFENSNIPSSNLQNLRNFKNTTTNLTPVASPKPTNGKDSQYKESSQGYLNVPNKDSLVRKTQPSSLSPTENNYTSSNKTQIYKASISTPSLYSTESSSSSDISNLNIPESTNDEKKNKDHNDHQKLYNDSFQNNTSDDKDSKPKKRFNFLSQSDNKDLLNIIGNSKTMSFFNNTKSKIENNREQQKSSNKTKPTKYFSSILQKYQQKFDNTTESEEPTIDVFDNSEVLHSSPIQITQKVYPASPVQIHRTSTINIHHNSIKDRPFKPDSHQNHIPNRTSSNQFIPKRTSSNNLTVNYKGYNYKAFPSSANSQGYENTDYNRNAIRQSKSISIAYQTKPNQQMVESSNQLFRHKTMSVSNYPMQTTSFSQGQFPMPYYQQQVSYSSQPVYPYYMDVIYPVNRSTTPQNSSQISVVYDTSIVQQPLPLAPNPAMIQPQSINSGTIPSAIPSPISPQSITYSNGITIRQNSYHSNYNTPSPYTHNIITTPVNNIYYPADANMATPVHIISPPPIVNPSISAYSFSSQEYIDNNVSVNHNFSADPNTNNNNFDKISRKSNNSINDNSSYDDSLYYHDIVDNENDGVSSNITKRSNTIGGSQNIRNELRTKGNGQNQYLHPNSYAHLNNSYVYDPITRSNSFTYEHPNNTVYDNKINVNVNHGFSYDNNVRINYPTEVYRAGSYDNTKFDINRNNSYYDPGVNYGGYVSSSFPVVYNSGFSLASSQSSIITDNGSNYYNSNYGGNKRRSGFSNFLKKKSNSRYSKDYQYINDSDKGSNSFYRSNSINTRNYNDTNSSINRSRSYSNSYRYKANYINRSNSSNFNNALKDKSKLNNVSVISNSENSLYPGNKSYTSASTTPHEDKNESSKTMVDSGPNSTKEDTSPLTQQHDYLQNETEDYSESEDEHDEKDHDEQGSVYEMTSTFVESPELNHTSLPMEKEERKEEEEEEKNQVDGTQLSTSASQEFTESLIDDYINESSLSESNEDQDASSIDESSEDEKEEVEDEGDEFDELDELPSKDNEPLFKRYNPDVYAKKMLDIESRRYSSISTYHLDNLDDKDTQSLLLKNNKYRHSDCNFETFIYDASFHIESIKNDLMENHSKHSDTIISINSNITNTDYNSERESYKNTEQSFISSIGGEKNDDQTDSNINYYINHEEIDNLSNYDSIRSGLDSFYERESLKDRRSELNSLRSRSDFINTSFSSLDSNSISFNNSMEMDKALPRPQRILKQAYRTNSTPAYSDAKTSPYLSDDYRNRHRFSTYSNLSTERYTNLPESKPMEKIASVSATATTTHNTTSNSTTTVPMTRQEPKIIKVHGSRKSGIKKTMSLILESSSKIFTKKQNQHPGPQPTHQGHGPLSQNHNQNQWSQGSGPGPGPSPSLSSSPSPNPRPNPRPSPIPRPSTSKTMNIKKKDYYANKELPPLPHPTDQDVLEQAKAELKLSRKKHHSFTPSGQPSFYRENNNPSIKKEASSTILSDMARFTGSTPSSPSHSFSYFDSPSLSNYSSPATVSKPIVLKKYA